MFLGSSRRLEFSPCNTHKHNTCVRWLTWRGLGVAMCRIVVNVDVNVDGNVHVHTYVHVNNVLAIFESDFDTSGEPGPHAEGVNRLETPLRKLHVPHRASSCSQRGGHVQLCSKSRGHAESNPRPSEEGVPLISSSDHWTVMSLTRMYRVEVWFGFVWFALLLAVVLC